MTTASATPAVLQFRDPVDVAQVEIDVTLLANLCQVLAGHPVGGAILRQITPPVVQPVGT